MNWFDEYYTKPASVLVFSHYPPLDTIEFTDGQLRYRAHSDYTGFTLLLQDPHDHEAGAGGLEIDVGGKWVPVLPRKDCFVVNLGDLFETWTNDVWRSTPHRVTAPQLGTAAASRSRYTVMLFSGPDTDAIIAPMPTCVSEERPPRYEAVKASDHLIRMYNTKSREAEYNPAAVKKGPVLVDTGKGVTAVPRS
jgi:isopenicillin N synthase-like dioxygenase